MLVLSRKPGEAIQIDENITVTVIKINGSRVRVGINAPREVRIIRGELNDFGELSFSPETQLCAPASQELCNA